MSVAFQRRQLMSSRLRPSGRGRWARARNCHRKSVIFPKVTDGLTISEPSSTYRNGVNGAQFYWEDRENHKGHLALKPLPRGFILVTPHGLCRASFNHPKSLRRGTLFPVPKESRAVPCNTTILEDAQVLHRYGRRHVRRILRRPIGI